jgi:hypothetical protein
MVELEALEIRRPGRQGHDVTTHVESTSSTNLAGREKRPKEPVAGFFDDCRV